MDGVEYEVDNLRINSHVLQENRKKKIDFSLKNVLSYCLLEFLFPIFIYCYFIYSLCKEENTLNFWVSFSFGVAVPHVISCMSLCICWKDNKTKLTEWGPFLCSKWWCTLSRWGFHLFLPLPSIPRYIFYSLYNTFIEYPFINY